MPAYNAGSTLRQTVAEIDRQIVDEIVLVDDESSGQDHGEVASRLNLKVIDAREEPRLRRRTRRPATRAALELGADIVIMLHPDYQYTPRLIPAMAERARVRASSTSRSGRGFSAAAR